MGAIDAVFDTNILIDHLKGVPSAIAALSLPSAPAISIITWIEVLAGVNPLSEVAARTLLGFFVVLPVTVEIAERAANIRRTTRLKLPDAIILATAQVSVCNLVTRNTRDFAPGTHGVYIPYVL